MTKRWSGLAALVVIAACQRATELDVRTFPIEHLSDAEVWALVQPYVYENRPDAGGMVSTSGRAVTVRETPDNLDRIAAVLAQHDVARPDVRLVFQLIEADGFTDSDPRIADVVTQLRSVFQFRGYRLAGEAVVTATDNSEVEQRIRAADGEFMVTAEAHRMGASTIRLEEVVLWSDPGTPVLRTTVNVRPGQTLVLGSSPRPGSTATLLLTVRAEETE